MKRTENTIIDPTQLKDHLKLVRVFQGYAIDDELMRREFDVWLLPFITRWVKRWRPSVSLAQLFELRRR